VASLVFSLAERKPLNDDLRSRLAARSVALRLETIRPFAGSLERDPVHHSTYYLAVDAPHGAPWLLHMAPAAAPTSAIFAKPLLIGRMRRATGPEIVLNAVPFGARDHDIIGRFVQHINPVFQPRAQGGRPAIVMEASPAAFEGFRGILKSGNRNLAAIELDAAAVADSYHAALWTAIRAGWREGFSAGITVPLSGAEPGQVKETIRQAAPLTRFTAAVGPVVGPGGVTPALQAAERLHELIRQTRAAARITRPFDFELSLEGSPSPTTPGDLGFCLEWLRQRGHAAQLVAPQPGGDLAELAAAARLGQCTLSFDARAADPAALARAAAGRVHLRRLGQSPEGLLAIAEQLRA